QRSINQNQQHQINDLQKQKDNWSLISSDAESSTNNSEKLLISSLSVEKRSTPISDSNRLAESLRNVWKTSLSPVTKKLQRNNKPIIHLEQEQKQCDMNQLYQQIEDAFISPEIKHCIKKHNPSKVSLGFIHISETQSIEQSAMIVSNSNIENITKDSAQDSKFNKIKEETYVNQHQQHEKPLVSSSSISLNSFHSACESPTDYLLTTINNNLKSTVLFEQKQNYVSLNELNNVAELMLGSKLVKNQFENSYANTEIISLPPPHLLPPNHINLWPRKRQEKPTPTMSTALPSSSVSSMSSTNGRMTPLTLTNSMGMSTSFQFGTNNSLSSSVNGSSSPLTIGSTDNIPIAMAYQEMIHAMMNGEDETKWKIRIQGDMLVSFPAAILHLLSAPVSQLSPLEFRLRNLDKVENIIANPQLVS
ncbi:unnamed protein product, partial [Didymodactylos carnosus]